MDEFEIPPVDPEAVKEIQIEYEEYCRRRSVIVKEETEKLLIKLSLYSKDSNGNPVFDDKLKKTFEDIVDNRLPLSVGIR